ncbi:MAG TPA: hypothetical protein VFL83_01635 [Anaeromyxobacter sp.]|nr:hypothetical protein [Anaeromyxobacter sp.]
MPAAARETKCPHCRAPLSRLGLDELMNDHPYDLVCFNDECPYYVRGWTWMEQQYGVHASYRYRRDAANGLETPVPVWSSAALRDAILPDDAAGAAVTKEHP